MRVKLDNGKKKEVDMRVSSLPTIFGEKIVARILDQENAQDRPDQARASSRNRWRSSSEAIARPWGIILVTGPTGSGKTNTLYSAISTLNAMEKNIMTAEDPVEFYMPGHQPGQHPGRDRPDLRRRPAGLPAPGPRHHAGRRDARPARRWTSPSRPP